MRDNRLKLGPGAVIGTIILILGIVLLLDRQGVVEAGRVLTFFWPAVLLVAGIAKLIQAEERSGSRVFGALLAGAGILLFLNKLGYLQLHARDIWPIILIAVGVMLLWSTLLRHTGPPTPPGPTLNKWTIFGGGEIVFDTKEFQGGELFAMFGGWDVKLHDADMNVNEVVLEANAMFGGIEIHVPETWTVVLEATALMGGYSDKTRHPKFDGNTPTKRLRVRGVALFGGVEVKN
jgi:predicted membrane protein